MKYIRYSKYTGEPADDVDLQELVKRLGDFFLQSGFESQYYGISEMDPEKTMEALRAGHPARAARRRPAPRGPSRATHSGTPTPSEAASNAKI